jgi:hypothetical protein
MAEPMLAAKATGSITVHFQHGVPKQVERRMTEPYPVATDSNG